MTGGRSATLRAAAGSGASLATTLGAVPGTIIRGPRDTDGVPADPHLLATAGRGAGPGALESVGVRLSGAGVGSTFPGGHDALRTSGAVGLAAA
jgi:hypothetical protein